MPHAFLHIRTPTLIEKTIQLNTSNMIAQYNNATPSLATSTVVMFLA